MYRMHRDAYDQFESEELVYQQKEKKMIINNTYLEDVESQLYPGCSKYTKLSSVAILFKHKVLHVLSNKGFIEIL